MKKIIYLFILIVSFAFVGCKNKQQANIEDSDSIVEFDAMPEDYVAKNDKYMFYMEDSATLCVYDIDQKEKKRLIENGHFINVSIIDDKYIETRNAKLFHEGDASVNNAYVFYYTYYDMNLRKINNPFYNKAFNGYYIGEINGISEDRVDLDVKVDKNNDIKGWGSIDGAELNIKGSIDYNGDAVIVAKNEDDEFMVMELKYVDDSYVGKTYYNNAEYETELKRAPEE